MMVSSDRRILAGWYDPVNTINNRENFMSDYPLLKASEIIDPDMGIHYAYHRTLKTITSIHKHDFYEFFLIVKGKAVHKINGITEIIDEGTLVFIRPDDVHSYERHDNKNFELINLAFTPSTLYPLLDYYGEGYNSERLLKSEFPPKLKLREVEKELLTARFTKLNTLSRKNKKRLKTEFRILIAEIFSRYFDKTAKEPDKDIPGWVVSLREEIGKKENFTAGITKMYELSGRSAEHLSRIFRKYYNETPTEYITHLRLNYAANMLANSDDDITSVSMDAGFENLSHFYHLFKKQFSSSPREFRLKHQKLIIPG
jgi:AraC family transcriptional regulator, dual regulator of chb operon